MGNGYKTEKDVGADLEQDEPEEVEADDPLDGEPKVNKPGEVLKQPKPGGWISVPLPEKGGLDTREARRRARQLEREEQQAEQRQQEQPKLKQKQVEEEVDSSLQMLEMLTQNRADEPRRDRSRSRRGRLTREVRSRRREMSRSRSVSFQLEPSPRREAKRRPRDDRRSFEEALRQRMKERESHDTTRGNIVQENYQGKVPKRLSFDPIVQRH